MPKKKPLWTCNSKSKIPFHNQNSNFVVDLNFYFSSYRALKIAQAKVKQAQTQQQQDVSPRLLIISYECVNFPLGICVNGRHLFFLFFYKDSTSIRTHLANTSHRLVATFLITDMFFDKRILTKFRGCGRTRAILTYLMEYNDSLTYKVTISPFQTFCCPTFLIVNLNLLFLDPSIRLMPFNL